MEGLNISFISGEIFHVGGDKKLKRSELFIRRVKNYFRMSRRARVLTPEYEYFIVWGFGVTAPCGTSVCIPCRVIGGDAPETATVFLDTTFISKSPEKETSPTACSAWITGEIVGYTPVPGNSNYTNIILKSNERFLKAKIQIEKNKTDIGDYILANCTVNATGSFYDLEKCKTVLFINSFINLPKDNILSACDMIKERIAPGAKTKGDIITL